MGGENLDNKLVVVPYEALKSRKDLSKEIMKAYMRGLGVLAVSDVPGFEEARNEVLSYGHKLAHLPKDALKALEDEKSLYNAGWSHGKEKLGDKPDFAKGSFYFNPLSDIPGTKEDREKYPVSYPSNIWPKEHMPELEPAAKKLGKIMHDCAVELSWHIDEFAATNTPGYTSGLLTTEMQKTDKAKGRLLYYFPMSKEKTEKADSWIGWHNDTGFLTTLAGDIYVDDESGKVIECPDANAGLYVVDRNGEEVKVDIPKNCMAIQLGECVQIITGGALTATPHYVRGASPTDSSVRVARVSLPVFIDTPPTFPLDLPEGADIDKVYLSSNKVPPLRERWNVGMNFGEFLGKSFEKYYEHLKK